ncbi:hypothetical protein HMPREF9073_00292 [Capnocytophaga sp. oral taxon 326 str. F0382]|nr:hypothetical protein HMPREF9073_00292 [Capnocytophaga sp. oral taxon 326 str. F0382]
MNGWRWSDLHPISFLFYGAKIIHFFVTTKQIYKFANWQIC